MSFIQMTFGLFSSG